MLPHLAIPAVAAVLGLVPGSFLNVVIVRLPNDESIVTPRSKCPHCDAPLAWYDNIPLLSWLLLRGRCRQCGNRISWRYPAVEVATAVWFAVSFAALGRPFPADVDSLLQLAVACTATATLGWFLIGLAVIDWRDHILPNVLTYSGIFAGLLFACMQALFLSDTQDDVVLQHPIHLNAASSGRSTGNVFLTGPEHVLFARLFAAVAAFLLLYLIRTLYKTIRKRDGMGLGDAKLLALIASFLGFAPTAVALVASILLATVFAVFLLLRRNATAATRLPFGSFLAAGGLLAALYGQRVADGYLALFR